MSRKEIAWADDDGPGDGLGWVVVWTPPAGVTSTVVLLGEGRRCLTHWVFVPTERGPEGRTIPCTRPAECACCDRHVERRAKNFWPAALWTGREPPSGPWERIVLGLTDFSREQMPIGRRGPGFAYTISRGRAANGRISILVADSALKVPPPEPFDVTAVLKRMWAGWLNHEAHGEGKGE